MTPCDRLVGGNVGCCSDWIGRESGYADFADDRRTFVPLNEPNCRSLSIETGGSSCRQDGHRFTGPCATLLYPNQEKDLISRSVPPDIAMAEPPSYGVISPATIDVAPSIPIGELSSHCGQFNDCAPSAATGSSKNCQGGPVDVEDLALYFDADKQQIGCHSSRSLRATNSSQQPTSNYRRSRSKYDYPDTPPQRKIVAQDFGDPRGRPSVSYNLADWYGEEFCNGCPEQFPLCSEERWFQCPASDRCPVYDATYASTPYGQQHVSLPPCVYENFGADYPGWPYGCYAEDEQLLEDYLSNEKRKEKSRDAARYRRSKETDIFTELSAVLPVPPEQAANLDKASVMRLAIAYLKVRAVVDSVPVPVVKTESSTEMDDLFPRALNGFMLVLSSDGNMVYLSENVTDYLGISQMDMMGQSVYEYSHPCDHDELRECLSSKPPENNDKRVCSFFLRLKCTITSKGRKVNLKSASYKVIHCTGRLTYIRNSVSSKSTEIDEEEPKTDDEVVERDTGASLVLVGCPIPHPSNIEIPLGRHTFLSKHCLSMKFTYADEKLAEYLGWNSEELMGQSVFEFYHALDNVALDKSFKSLFSKGQCETVAYRFLGKRGGYAWVVTQATLIHCSKQQKPLSVVCVNYILSGIEREDEVYSARQLAARDTDSGVKSTEKKLLGSCATASAVTSAATSATTIEPPRVQLEVRVSSADLEEPPFLPVERESPVTLGQEPSANFDEEREDERTKPLAVTTSTFRSAGEKVKKEVPRVQDGSRKDNTFPRPVHHVTEETFVGVRALKESLEEALKENEEPKRKRQDRRPLAARAPFIFQGKPALRYNPETAGRRDRPQAVTRQLFTPLPSAQQQQQQQQEQISCRPPPQTATASIFAPRTEDMNKGFLTFSEDQPGLTMLKDEPEDLTHLAPTPGDVCVPLEDTPFLSDMLDEFILGNDNYCPLLSPGGVLAPELRTDFGDPLKDGDLGDSARNKSLGESLADSDPFMYGDPPSSPCIIDPNAVSSSLAKYRQSPERSMDSLGSPTGGSVGEGLSEDEMLMLGITDSIADDELALRAPYIPMSDQDEALEFLVSDDMVMWSPSQTMDKMSSKWIIDDREQRVSDSSLAQLLRTDQVASRRYNDHGGGLVNPAQVLGQIPRRSTALDTGRWSTKTDRTDRPTKRIHTAPLDTESENKRIKCDEPRERGNPRSLEDHLLNKQTSPRRSPAIGGSSQLLRRLVSQQAILRNNYSSDSLENSNGDLQSNNRIRDLNGDLEMNEADGDGDGGGKDDGGGDRCCENLENGDAGQTSQTSQNSQRAPPCSSVLMNLLVSGCDDTLMDSRNVPTLPSKNLTIPLSVNLDNQMVPQSSDSEGPLSFEDLSPGARKHLSSTFLSTGTIVSPSSPMMPFENFDYDPGISGSGLLQVQSDLFGNLLDQTLV